MGQEKVWLLTHILLACLCAIPMNSDILLEIEGVSVDTCKPSLGVTFHPMSLLGRPPAYMPYAILHPGYKVFLVANYERHFQKKSVQMAILLSVQCCTMSSIDFP